jgi:hypothetical protein
VVERDRKSVQKLVVEVETFLIVVRQVLMELNVVV